MVDCKQMAHDTDPNPVQAEAIDLRGESIFLNCETVGETMAKIAMERHRLATHIVVMDPASGRHLQADDVQLPRVEFVVVNEEDATVNVNSCLLNLRLHATQNDRATCLSVLDTLRLMHHGTWDFQDYEIDVQVYDNLDFNRLAIPLCDVFRHRNRNWRLAAKMLMGLGLSADFALVQAATDGWAEIVEFLMSEGQAPLLSALVAAVRAGWTEVVQILVSAGGDANAWARSSTGVHEVTLLMSACRFGHSDVVEILLRARASVNEESAYGTALAQTFGRGRNWSVVEMMLSAGADPNAQFYNGDTLLMRALGDEVLVQILMSARADMNAALMKASARGDRSIVEEILRESNCVNTRGDTRETALIVASENGRVGVVEALLAAKADINATDDAHRTAMVAAFDKHEEVVHILLAARIRRAKMGLF